MCIRDRYILFAVAAFSACSDDNQGEVVSQDLSYQLDANYVFVDIPEKMCIRDRLQYCGWTRADELLHLRCHQRPSARTFVDLFAAEEMVG